MPLDYPHRRKQLESLVNKLGLSQNAPIQWDLLDLALIHPTASSEANYEQLEFVGDAVVRLVAAEFLWEHYHELPVGEFTAIRSILVSDRMLARIAANYGFGRYLLGATNIFRDELGQSSLLAESFEAVLGALYLSTHTLQLIRPWLDEHFHTLVKEILDDPARQNYKAALQEWTQGTYKVLPEYRIQQSESTSPTERFAAEVWILGQCWGKGVGRSIKAAEQAAAEVAFLALSQQAQAESP